MKYLRNKNTKTELEELEDIVGNLGDIEPDFSSLGLEPPEILGFSTEKELENALKLLTMDINSLNSVLIDYLQ